MITNSHNPILDPTVLAPYPFSNQNLPVESMDRKRKSAFTAVREKLLDQTLDDLENKRHKQQSIIIPFYIPIIRPDLKPFSSTSITNLTTNSSASQSGPNSYQTPPPRSIAKVSGIAVSIQPTVEAAPSMERKIDSYQTPPPPRTKTTGVAIISKQIEAAEASVERKVDSAIIIPKPKSNYLWGSQSLPVFKSPPPPPAFKSSDPVPSLTDLLPEIITSANPLPVASAVASVSLASPRTLSNFSTFNTESEVIKELANKTTEYNTQYDITIHSLIRQIKTVVDQLVDSVEKKHALLAPKDKLKESGSIHNYNITYLRLQLIKLAIHESITQCNNKNEQLRKDRETKSVYKSESDTWIVGKCLETWLSEVVIPERSPFMDLEQTTIYKNLIESKSNLEELVKNMCKPVLEERISSKDILWKFPVQFPEVLNRNNQMCVPIMKYRGPDGGKQVVTEYLQMHYHD